MGGLGVGASRLFAWGWREGRGEERGGAFLFNHSFSPTSPLSVPMDRITAESSPNEACLSAPVPDQELTALTSCAPHLPALQTFSP